MTTREEALAALADLSDESVHRKRLAAIADALNADPPATWDQIGAALGGKAGSNTHRKYAKQLDVRRQVRVKPDTGSPQDRTGGQP